MARTTPTAAREICVSDVRPGDTIQFRVGHSNWGSQFPVHVTAAESFTLPTFSSPRVRLTVSDFDGPKAVEDFFPPLKVTLVRRAA